MHCCEYGNNIWILYEARNDQRLKDLRVRYPFGKREFPYAVTFLESRLFKNSQEIILQVMLRAAYRLWRDYVLFRFHVHYAVAFDIQRTLHRDIFL